MSTFYLLPPRPCVGERFAGYLRILFPGLDWPSAVWPQLAESLCTAAHQPDVYVVCREELPQGESPARALIDGFGAEAGDEVVEVRQGGKPGELITLRWRVAG